jgi:hypothetical protein
LPSIIGGTDGPPRKPLNVVSIRDFLLAVQVGGKTAVAMLDKTESRLLEVLETLNEDYVR